MNVPNQISTSTPNSHRHRAIDAPPSQTIPPTPATNADENSNTGPFGERSELGHHGEKVGEMDARLGAPVPIGARVWIYETDGIVIDYTDQLCIIVDKDGRQHAECWGTVQVQAAGPATPEAIERLRHRMDGSDTNYEPLPAHVAQHVRDGILKHAPADGVPRTHQADPAYQLSNLVLQLVDHIAQKLEALEAEFVDLESGQVCDDCKNDMPTAEEILKKHCEAREHLLDGMLKLEELSGDIRSTWLRTVNSNQLVSNATHG